MKYVWENRENQTEVNICQSIAHGVLVKLFSFIVVSLICHKDQNLSLGFLYISIQVCSHSQHAKYCLLFSL